MPWRRVVRFAGRRQPLVPERGGGGGGGQVPLGAGDGRRHSQSASVQPAGLCGPARATRGGEGDLVPQPRRLRAQGGVRRQCLVV